METTLLAPVAQALVPELEHEAELTRRVLERIPAEQFGWQPHPKSMTLGHLASHTADLIGGIANTFASAELDLAAYDELAPAVPANTAELVQRLDTNAAAANAALLAATPATLAEIWTMRFGAQTIMQIPRADVVRHLINHTVHHRGQLSVYLRLLDIAVPCIYGPTADEEYNFG